MNKLKKKYSAWRRDRAERKLLKIRVAVRTSTWLAQVDVLFGFLLAITWGSGAFDQDSSTADRVSFAFLGVYLFFATLNARRDRNSLVRLGELVVKYQRQLGEKGLDPLDQVLQGDATLAIGVRPKPGSDGRWRTISWAEADVASMYGPPPTTGSKVAP